MVDAVKAVYSRYFEFSGRASRAEYWWFYLFFMLVYVGIIIAAAIVAPSLTALASLFALVSFIPSLAVSIRRMHDAGHSGWWLLVPIVSLVFSLFGSEPRDNRWGPTPS